LGGLLKHNFSALREGEASQKLLISQEETLEMVKNLITIFTNSWLKNNDSEVCKKQKNNKIFY
jgi:hypothetical protein